MRFSDLSVPRFKDVGPRFLRLTFLVQGTLLDTGKGIQSAQDRKENFWEGVCLLTTFFDEWFDYQQKHLAIQITATR